MDQSDSTGAEKTASEHPGLQPVVARSQLHEFDNTTAAKHLARLEADTMLMLQLSSEGFDGKAWRKISDALVEYGLTVMRSWIVTGLVFQKTKAKGRTLPAPPPSGIPRDDALELAADSVTNAIIDFQDRVLKTGMWNPSKGASLTSFFIGNCLLFQFPNLYRSWRKQRLRVFASLSIDDGRNSLQLASHHDPASEVIAADQTTRIVNETLSPIKNDITKTMLKLRADGYGIDEIAELLDLDYSSVESKIYRARKKLGRTQPT